MTEKDKMLTGNLYDAGGAELSNLRNRARSLMDKINKTSHNDDALDLFRELFKSLGQNAIISKPFYCDYGFNITIGNDFYANYDTIMLDVNEIIIGNNVFLAPRVSIFTAGHPVDKDIRKSGLEYGLKVVIGNDVWIGGNVVINPGVTIGSNVIIGSGSVVTKDIPDNVIAVGNPCKVLRKITNEDKVYWTNKQEEHSLY